MTADEFAALKPGDVVLDRHCRMQPRKIHSISVVRDTRGQRPGRARYGLTVDNLKSTNGTTVIFVSDLTHSGLP